MTDLKPGDIVRHKNIPDSRGTVVSVGTTPVEVEWTSPGFMANRPQPLTEPCREHLELEAKAADQIDRDLDAANLAEPDVDERGRLAELIWNVSRRDEGTISATGANIVADAILAAGYSRTPDAHLAAAKELESAAEDYSVAYQKVSAVGMQEVYDFLRARAARLREQGGQS